MECALGNGITLRDATQGDFDLLVANLRDMDRREHEALGGEPWRIADMVHAVGVWHETGGLVGIWGSMCAFGNGPLHNVRFWPFLTTRAADGIRKTYVRMSRPVLRAIWAREDPWVDTAFAVPADFYAGSKRWQERILGAERTREVVLNGVPHVVYVYRREKEGGT